MLVLTLPAFQHGIFRFHRLVVYLCFYHLSPKYGSSYYQQSGVKKSGQQKSALPGEEGFFRQSFPTFLIFSIFT
jgi:hypothetical protein